MTSMRLRALVAPMAFFLLGLLAAEADAALLVTNFFFDTVDRYDDQTGQLLQPGIGFFTPPNDNNEWLGLNGIVVDSATNNVFVSGRFSHRVYVFDGNTGQALASTPTGIPGVFGEYPGLAPAGLALDSSGNLYVAFNGGVTVGVYDSAGNPVAPVAGISDPLLALASGLTFDASGDLFITNLSGTNVLKYSGGSVSQFAAPNVFGLPFVPNGIVVDSDGSAYVADVLTNGIYKYDASGAPITGPTADPFFPSGPKPFIYVDIPRPGFATAGNAPSGIIFDQNGNLLVAALGSTNSLVGGSADQFEQHGALLRYDTNGTLIQTLGVDLPPYAGLALIEDVTSVPEPAAIGLALLGAAALVAMMKRHK